MFKGTLTSSVDSDKNEYATKFPCLLGENDPTDTMMQFVLGKSSVVLLTKAMGCLTLLSILIYMALMRRIINSSQHESWLLLR